ncbi:MAG: hypothetical protein O2807_07650, partial [bacterium]|nr:hypothetical protein [bacterium]
MVFDLHPNVLALLAAVIIAFAQVFYRESLRTMAPAATVLISSFTISACSFFYYFALTDGVAAWPLKGLLWFALAGAVGNFFGR